MPPSSQSLAPSSTPAPSRVLQVSLSIARPNMSGPFVQHDKPIGVAAMVSEGEARSRHWMAGYAQLDDFGRAAMILHLLQLPEYRGALLEVSCRGLKENIGYVPGARSRGGLRTNGKPFKGYDVLEPLEAAMARGEWTLTGESGGENYLTDRALQVALTLIPEFNQHKAAHPDWWMLRVGNTHNPHGEDYEPR